jgi:hypothetical protein
VRPNYPITPITRVDFRLDTIGRSPRVGGASKSEYDKYGKVARDIGLVPN